MLSRIHAKYDAEHEYSVSALEMYASCPFRFFSERILEILHVDVPDETLDPKVRGLLLHDALQTFHSHYASRPVVEIPADEARETMRSVAIETFRKNAWRSPGLSKGVAHVEEQRLIATLGRYLHTDRARHARRVKRGQRERGVGPVPGAGRGFSCATGPKHQRGRGMNESTTAGDWQGLRAGNRWQMPARYNMAWDMCEKWAEAEPDRLALVYLRPDGEVREYSFAQLSRASNRFANALAGHGVARGDRVAVLLGPGPETILAHLAAYKLGAIALPLLTLFG